jgi:hypothetical protein
VRWFRLNYRYGYPLSDMVLQRGEDAMIPPADPYRLDAPNSDEIGMLAPGAPAADQPPPLPADVPGSSGLSYEVLVRAAVASGVILSRDSFDRLLAIVRAFLSSWDADHAGVHHAHANRNVIFSVAASANIQKRLINSTFVATVIRSIRSGCQWCTVLQDLHIIRDSHPHLSPPAPSPRSDAASDGHSEVPSSLSSPFKRRRTSEASCSDSSPEMSPIPSSIEQDLVARLGEVEARSSPVDAASVSSAFSSDYAGSQPLTKPRDKPGTKKRKNRLGKPNRAARRAALRRQEADVSVPSSSSATPASSPLLPDANADELADLENAEA